MSDPHERFYHVTIHIPNPKDMLGRQIYDGFCHELSSFPNMNMLLLPTNTNGIFVVYSLTACIERVVIEGYTISALRAMNLEGTISCFNDIYSSEFTQHFHSIIKGSSKTKGIHPFLMMAYNDLQKHYEELANQRESLQIIYMEQKNFYDVDYDGFCLNFTLITPSRRVQFLRYDNGNPKGFILT